MAGATVDEVDHLLAAPLDPTAYSGVGRVVALLCLLGALVVALRWWFQNRDR